MIDDSQRYLNRELANLDFQERVLELAENDRLPLLERVKFVAIVSHNLDEFFQVRVAGLLNQVESDVTPMSPDGLTAAQQLEHIEAKSRAVMERIDALVGSTILPGLEKNDIRVVGVEELSAADRDHLAEVFEETIFPVLTPLAVDPSHPFPYISDLSLNLAVLLRPPGRENVQFARIKIPPILPRFVVLPDGERFVPLENVVAAHLARLFGGQEVVEHSFFRVTRNADYAVEEQEAHDLLQAMESVLQFRRRSAAAVRLEIGPAVTERVERLLIRELGITPRQVFRRTAPLDLSGLWTFVLIVV
jgi:polyphosphate kinase